MAASYHLTGSLYAPLLTHSLNNSIVAALYVMISPNSSYDVREWAMRTFWRLDKWFTKSHNKTRIMSPSITTSSALLNDNGQPSEFYHRIVDTILDVLDEDNDGKLTSSEIAYFISLDNSLLPLAEAAWIAVNKYTARNQHRDEQSLTEQYKDPMILPSIQPSYSKHSKQEVYDLHVELLHKCKEIYKLYNAIREFDDVFTEKYASKYVRRSAQGDTLTMLSTLNAEKLYERKRAKFCSYWNQFVRNGIAVNFNDSKAIDKAAFKEFIMTHTWEDVAGTEESLFHVLSVLCGDKHHPFEQFMAPNQ
jgi:hypothetical protein